MASLIKTKEKQTLESAEAKLLTTQEKQKLSREMILEWFKKHRFDKLKGLQLDIASKTQEEKMALRDLIIKNTQKSLEKQKRAAEKEKVRKIERFADAITSIDEEPASLNGVLTRFEREQKQEEIFFATLDTYVGKEKNKKYIQNLIRENKHIAGLLKMINETNPKAMHDVNLAINQGDYEEIKKALIKSHSSITAQRVDYCFGLATTTEFGKKEYTGNKTVDGIINWVGKARYVGHTAAMNRAAEASGVSVYLLMRFGLETMASLRKIDENFKQHKHLLEGKEKMTLKDRERLQFIEQFSKMRVALDSKIEGKGMESKFRSILDKYLDTKKGLTEQQKADIRATASFNDLRLFQVCDLVFSGEDAENLLIHGWSRGAALGLQYWRLMRDENRRLRSALTSYHKKRFKNKSIWEFKKNAKLWKMDDILQDINKLDKKIQGMTADLAQRAERYQIDVQGKNVSTNELYDRDMIMKRFHVLSNAASRAMTKQAKPVLNAGKVLEKGMRQFGENFEKMTGSQLLHNQDEVVKALGIKPDDLAKLKGKDLIGIYGNKLVDLKTMQDVTRARFAALAENLQENVDTPFQKKLAGQKADIADAKFRRKTSSQLDNISAPSKAKKWGRRAILPAIFVGVESYRLIKGKGRTDEVLWNAAEAGLGFVPVIGTGLDFKAAFWGESLAGRKLDTKERVLSFAFGCIGVVADVTTVIGGAGLGLRATIGGMKGARGAMRAAKATRAARGIDKFSDAGHIVKTGLVGRMAGKISDTFGTTRRLEKATQATVEAKALKEAAIIHDLENAAGGKRLDTSNLEALKKELKGNASAQRSIKRLEKLREGLDPGASYMKMLESTETAVRVPPHELSKLKGYFSRVGMKIKSAFLEVKAGLLKIGVPSETLKEYEKSFGAVKNLEKMHAEKWDEIKALAKQKDLSESKLRYLEQLKGKATKKQKDFLETLEKERELLSKKKALELERDAIIKEHEAIAPAQKIYNKAQITGRELTKAEKAEIDKILLAAEKKGYRKLSQKEFLKLSKKRSDATRELKDVNKKLEATTAKKGKLDGELKVQNSKWHKDVMDNHKAIEDYSTAMAAKQDELKVINSRLNDVSDKRYRLYQEMEMKAESWIARSDNMRRASRYLQFGGLAMGGIWYLTNTDPSTQVEYAAKGIKYAGKGAGKALNTIYIENHAGKPALDLLIEKKVYAIKRKKKMDGIIADAQARGKSKLEILAENSDDPGAQEIIKREGLKEKILAMRQKIAGKLPSRREISTGDSARKAGEKLTG